MVTHKWLGPPIESWQKHGVIRTRSKVIAIFLIILSFTYVLVFRQVMIPVKVFLFLLGVSVIVFIGTRPSKVSKPEEAG
ncbi:MAG: DUF454 family protein [Pseudomonadota bacterium]